MAAEFSTLVSAEISLALKLSGKSTLPVVAAPARARKIKQTNVASAVFVNDGGKILRLLPFVFHFVLLRRTNAVFVQFIAQRANADAEQFRGVSAILPGPLQTGEDVFFFQFRERHQLDFFLCCWLRAFVERNVRC